MAKLEFSIDVTQYAKLYRKAVADAFCLLFENDQELSEILNILDIGTEDEE